jgi:antitoxin component of MazEF toxin-antitoxin module
MSVPEQGFNLEQLLAEVTKDNLHHEIETGSATGNETW